MKRRVPGLYIEVSRDFTSPGDPQYRGPDARARLSGKGRCVFEAFPTSEFNADDDCSAENLEIALRAMENPNDEVDENRNGRAHDGALRLNAWTPEAATRGNSLAAAVPGPNRLGPGPDLGPCSPG